MQYLIVEKLSDGTDHVILGPMNWRPTFFKNVLMDDLEIDYDVPQSNDHELPIFINGVAKILPVKDIGVQGELNPKTQIAQGPFYNYFDDHAEAYWVPEDKNIDWVKSELKSIIAANRFKYEVKGIKLTIQGKEVEITTARGFRDLFLQAYQLGRDGVNWKFGEEFLTLSNTELEQIVQAVTSHVQSAFDWESSKVSEIDSANSLVDVDAISLVSDNPEWEPPVVNPLVG